MNNLLQDLAVVEYGASPRDIKSDFRTDYAIYGTGGKVGYSKLPLFNGPVIVIARKGTLDNPIYSKDACWIIDTAYGVIPKENVDSKWLYYQLVKYDLRKLNESTGVPSINREYLKRIKIHSCTFKEQQKIAAILSTVDSVIEKTQASIDKYKAIKQGMLHDLFTRGIDLKTGKIRPRLEDAPKLYKKSPLGMVPKEWDVKQLGDVTEKIGSGVTPTGGSEVYISAGVLFIRSQNVLRGSLSLDDVAYISSDVDDSMEYSRVKPFDVLLNITGASIGRCAYFPEKLGSANVNQHVCIIRFPNAKEHLALFGSEYLNSSFGRNQISKSTAGGNREGLNFQQIKSFMFPVVPTKELEKISLLIMRQSKIYSVELKNYKKLVSIKSGLMEDLLSGKKRVKVTKRGRN